MSVLTVLLILAATICCGLCAYGISAAVRRRSSHGAATAHR